MNYEVKEYDDIVIQVTSEELREHAYETERLIKWGRVMLTVDEANDMFLKYSAERSPKADELTALIAATKAEIRERFPDAE